MRGSIALSSRTFGLAPGLVPSNLVVALEEIEPNDILAAAGFLRDERGDRASP